MFCHKCGAAALDDAEFCQKCGAKLNVAQQKQAEEAVRQVQTGNVPADVPKKKKSRKLPIILGAIVLILAAFAILGSMDSKRPADVNLSQTYTNEEEGISFQYPSAWVPVSEEEFAEMNGAIENSYPLVILANVTEGLPENTTYISVSKYWATQEDIDYIFMDDEQFIHSIDSEVSVKEASITELDGIPARKFTYFTPSDGLGSESWFYAVGSTIYRIDFSWVGESPANNQRFFDAVIGSYKITAPETADAGNVLFPLAVSTDAEKVFQEWESMHPLGGYYHLDLISDDETDSEGNKVFLFTLETDGAGIFNMTIRKSDGYMEYIEKFGSLGMDEWYREWFGTGANASSGGIVSAYREPIENYWRLSGYYNGGTDMSTLSLSIYSFQEEGETAIGNAEINLDSGQFYSGQVIPLEGNGYKVETGTQEEVLLLDYTSDATITLRLYIDGIFMEEYWMKQHYES